MSINVTFKGRTQSMLAWSKEYGINSGTLHNRLSRGKMSFEEALKMPVQNIFSPNRTIPTKSEAEIWLDEQPFTNLPKELQKLIPRESRTKKYGKHIRTLHRADFDKWFAKSYCKEIHGRDQDQHVPEADKGSVAAG